MQLELTNLTKKYGNFTALDLVNITFTPGIYGILGANGAGKSTMMNLLTDNISRTDGKILFNGTDILKLGKDFRSVLGYMPQQQGFYEHMTAQTFLYYMAELKGIPKKQAAQEIDALLEVTNLSDVRHKKLGGYSGGMKQRVGIARAYCNEPEVMLMDEPFGALDAQTRYMMQEELQRIWSTEKRTVIFVTNNIEEAIYLADRIIVLTNCPATVKKEYVIDLPRPRNLVSPEFLALRKEITGILDSSQLEG